MGPYGYGYPQQDPLAEMDYMQPRPPQFAPMQPPGLMQPPQQKQGGGLLSSFGGGGGGSGGGGLLGNATSLFGGGTGGANMGDMAHNWLGGLMNPAADPFGLNAKNVSAGLTQPDLSGEDMTNLVGGGQMPQMPQMQAPPLPQKQGDGGGLMKLAMLAMMA